MNRYPPTKCPWPLQSGPHQRVPNLHWLYLSRRPWLGLKCPVSNRSLTCTECPFPKDPWPVLSVPFQKVPDCPVHRDPPWLLLLPPLAYQSFLQEKHEIASLHQLLEMFYAVFSRMIDRFLKKNCNWLTDLLLADGLDELLLPLVLLLEKLAQVVLRGQEPLSVHQPARDVVRFPNLLANQRTKCITSNKGDFIRRVFVE